MSHADLTLSAWLDLSDGAAERTTAAIARSVEARLAAMGPHRYAGRVAFLDRDGIRYALVPGDTVQLGHDSDRFVPSARQLADFAEAAAAYGLTEPLTRFLAETTSPPREVFLPARLVAVHSEETDALLAANDEAGLDDSDGDYGHAWVPLIQAPNLFGLVIGDDPYRAEFTTDPAVMCGGDGGEAVCGGYGSFLSGLTLATAYRNPDLAETIYSGGLTGATPVRPVVQLA